MNNRGENNYQVNNMESVQGQVIGEHNRVTQNYHLSSYPYTIFTPEEADLQRLQKILKKANWKGVFFDVVGAISVFVWVPSLCALSKGIDSTWTVTIAFAFYIICIFFSYKIKNRFVELKTNGEINKYRKLRKEIRRMKRNL